MVVATYSRLQTFDQLMALDWSGASAHLAIQERVAIDFWVENARLDRSLEYWRRVVHGR